MYDYTVTVINREKKSVITALRCISKDENGETKLDELETEIEYAQCGTIHVDHEICFVERRFEFDVKFDDGTTDTYGRVDRAPQGQCMFDRAGHFEKIGADDFKPVTDLEDKDTT